MFARLRQPLFWIGLMVAVSGSACGGGNTTEAPETPAAATRPSPKAEPTPWSVAVVTSGPDWPNFRGDPLQNGIAKSKLPDQLEICWKFKTKDSIEAAAAIVAQTVYVGCMDENLYALDLATGKEKWHCKIGPIKAPPSVRDGAIYVGDADGMFHCVDAATGTERWKFETGGEIVSGANFSGKQILFGSYSDEALYSLSPEGKMQWQFKTQGPINGSPAVVADRTFVAGCDGALHVLDTVKGKEISAVDLGGPAGATAAVSGDQLYVGTISSNSVLGIDWKKGQVVWTFEKEDRQQPFYASAAVTDRLVIGGSRDKHVYGLDRASGKEVWSFATHGKVDSSPVVCGKRVYVGSTDGNLYVLDLDKGTLIQKIEVGRNVSASPAVAGGCLIIGTQDSTVVCLGQKRKAAQK
jgi:outer membrane protein assembly factor BamB